MIGKWKYLRRTDIDVLKWDECINKFSHAPVYALSAYLDYTADHWDALVLADYEAVMPLPWKRKLGIRYVYAPYFIQHLGLFGRLVDDNMIKDAIALLSDRFRWVDFNVDQRFNLLPGTIVRTNFILPLDKSYDVLRIGYSDQCRANLQKATTRGCEFVERVEATQAIDLFRKAYGHLHRATENDYQRFRQLLESPVQPFHVMVSGVKDSSSGSLLFAGVIIQYKNRLYYSMGAPTPEGRTARSTYFFIDQLVRTYSGSGLVLDFEGSDLPNVAAFYQRFGPAKEEYMHLRINNLPWFVRLLKP